MKWSGRQTVIERKILLMMYIMVAEFTCKCVHIAKYLQKSTSDRKI